MRVLVGFMVREPLGMAALRNDGPSEWRADTVNTHISREEGVGLRPWLRVK